jgi:hypothetical protein
MSLSLSAVTTEGDKMIKLNARDLVIPELKLMRKTTPVSMFLYIGSWEIDAKAKTSPGNLCHIDSQGNKILLKSTDRLLKNSRTRVVTRNNVNAFLNSIAWGDKQVTHIAFKVMSNRRQSAVVDLQAGSAVELFHNGRQVGSSTAFAALHSDGHSYLPIILESGENIIYINQ